MMVAVLDSTLREGEQTPGVYFPEHVKLEIANRLDRIGVEYIEAGHPGVSEEIYSAVRHLANLSLSSKIGAHSRSLRRDVDLALECGVKFLGIFYCVGASRLKGVFKTDLKSATAKIADAIAYAKQRNPDIIIRFTPEDTVRSKFENVVKSASAAVQAGADIISVADTTGNMIPHTERSMYAFVSHLKEAFERENVHPLIAVHCHNDRGLALANALEALQAGIDIIDASVLGLGERAGIVDLAALLATLSQDFGEDAHWDLEGLMPLYQLVSRYSNVPIPVNSPVVGQNAFKHCAGVHTHAAQINPLHYQSVDPAPFGRKMEISLDQMSGLSSVKYALEMIGEDHLSSELVRLVLGKVKEVGHTGRTVDMDELNLIVNWVQEKYKENRHDT